MTILLVDSSISLRFYCKLCNLTWKERKQRSKTLHSGNPTLTSTQVQTFTLLFGIHLTLNPACTPIGTPTAMPFFYPLTFSLFVQFAPTPNNGQLRATLTTCTSSTCMSIKQQRFSVGNRRCISTLDDQRRGPRKARGNQQGACATRARPTSNLMGKGRLAFGHNVSRVSSFLPRPIIISSEGKYNPLLPLGEPTHAADTSLNFSFQLTTPSVYSPCHSTHILSPIPYPSP